MNQLFESQMEDLIARNPDFFLKEEGLKLIDRQFRIGSYIFDLLFEDRHGAKLIVELQRGILDRGHCYKIFDYLDEFKSKNPLDFIDIIIVANEITSERKKMIAAKGIKFLEIPEKDFLEKLDEFQLSETKNDGKNTNEISIIRKVRQKNSRFGSPKQRIDSKKYFVTFNEFKELLNDYIISGKATQDKLARKKLILDILEEYLNHESHNLSAKFIFDLVKNRRYQKDYNNSFLRLIYYPLLVCDKQIDGKTLAEKIYYDVAVPGNPQYPNFKILEAGNYHLDEINLRLNFDRSMEYKKAVIDIINFVRNIDSDLF